MKQAKLLLVFFTVSFFFKNNITAQTDKGWEKLLTNNRAAAGVFFENAIKNNPNDAEAQLSMAYYSWINGKFDEPFRHVESFYKTHPNPYPYLYAIWSSDFCNLFDRSKGKNKMQFVKNIAEDKRADGRLRAIANYSLGLQYLDKNKNADAKKYLDKIGALKNWQVAGEFDNSSGSGFDKDYEPITKAQSDAKFTNKNGATVGWVTPKHFKLDGWIDFDYLSTEQSNSIFYAQTFVNSPADQDLVLCAGVSGSLKVWLNDALIGGVSEERNTDLDTYCYNVHLNKGMNRILIQTGGSDLYSLNFLVRLTDYNFEPIVGLENQADFVAYQKAAPYAKKMIPHSVEKIFQDDLIKTPNSLMSHFLLNGAYHHNGKIKESIAF